MTHKTIKIRNLYLGLVEQLPWKRLFRNFFVTGNAWGMFSKYSHIRKDGKLKVIYNTKASAVKAANNMSGKQGVHYSVCKCIYCDGYHIGRNKVR